MNQKQKRVQSLKTRLRVKFIVGAVSLGVLMAIVRLVYLNIVNSTIGKASPANALNNGEIISNFTWEQGEPTKATIGPDAIKISKGAYIAFGGRASTGGLAPGIPARDINMEIAASPLFDMDGIDVSIDFRCNESSGSFFTRGKSLDFGFDKNYLTISYRVKSSKGAYETINETTNYEILNDNLFRNYRFIYTPTTGKGEIFVNNAIVWSYEGEHNTPLCWNEKENIMIGKGIDGGGIDTPVLDNLIIRTTGSVSPLAESLINFTLKSSEGTVTINWSTTANNRVDNFTIQRSVNAVDFTTLTTIKADPSLNDTKEYSFTDTNFSSPGIYYYRVKQVFNDGRFITHNISATKVSLPEGLTIEKISPSFFQDSFSVSYCIPEGGKVQWQLVDETGKIKSNETVNAQRGKNIFQFSHIVRLPEGNYTLYLLYNDKKLSASVTKI